MAPKGKKSAGGAPVEEEGHHMLQAVVLTDSYETRFAPFTLERPRVRVGFAEECDAQITDWFGELLVSPPARKHRTHRIHSRVPGEYRCGGGFRLLWCSSDAGG
jgi:hypothetical protein